MGNSVSTEGVTESQVLQLFAQDCAKQFSSIEIWSLKTVFHRLESENGSVDLEDLADFLGLPSRLPLARALIVQSLSFLALFPYSELANERNDRPYSQTSLTLEALIRALPLYTNRQSGLLGEAFNINLVLYLSFAVWEPETPAESATKGDQQTPPAAISRAEITPWSQFGPVTQLQSVDPGKYYIPAAALEELFTLLLALVEFAPTHSMSDYSKSHFTATALAQYKASAQALIHTIPSTNDRIRFPEFEAAVMFAFPRIFESLVSVFDQLLFVKPKQSEVPSTDDAENHNRKDAQLQPPRPQPTSKLLSPALLAQLAIVLGREHVFGHLVSLYLGSSAGFSLQSFENKVLKWPTASLLIISGQPMAPDETGDSRKNSFDLLVPPTRTFRRSTQEEPDRVVFAALVDSPWQVSSKRNFGGSLSQLFQLYPSHDQYRPSTLRKNYAYFSKVSPHAIGFGGTPPRTVASRATFDIENVSLTIEGGLEYATFRHLGPGGSFHPSKVAPQTEFEYRFRIEDLEVWGYGSADELEEQKKRWEWEEREAEYRRNLNMGYKEGRALLELAGLVGGHREG